MINTPSSRPAQKVKSVFQDRLFVREATHIVALSDELKESLSSLLMDIDMKDESGVSDCLSFVKECLPEGFKDEVQNQMSGPFSEGWVLFKNLPTIKTNEMATILTSIVSSPIKFEKEGPMVVDIKPVQQHDQSELDTSYRTSNEFPLHTDMTYVDLPPDVFTLYSVREDFGQEARSLISVVRRAVQLLDKKTCRELAKPQFYFRSPSHYDLSGPEKARAVLTWEGVDVTCRFREDTVSLEVPLNANIEALQAIECFRRAMTQVAIEVRLSNHSAILLDNRRITHARSGFTPTYDENDRHLLRVFGTRNTEKYNGAYKSLTHTVT